MQAGKGSQIREWVEVLETWKEIIVEEPGLFVGWGGLLIGVLFGFIVYRTNFCTMGSISDILSFGNYSRFRAWLLAGATAIVGVAVLQSTGVINPMDSIYLRVWDGLLGGVHQPQSGSRRWG